MHTRFVEVTDGIAYGKFLVARMGTDELGTISAMSEANGARLLSYGGQRRFNAKSTTVMDLQRGTGAAWWLRGGAVEAEHYLREHLNGLERLVCPMYLPFVKWLHEQGTWAMGAGRLDDIPRYVEFSPWGEPESASPSDCGESLLAESQQSV